MNERIELPEKILSLNEAGEHVDCYAPAEAGAGYELTDAAREHIERCNRDLAEREAAHAEQLKELESKRAKSQRALERLLVSGEITQALDDAGVERKFHKVAHAGLEAELADRVRFDEANGETRVAVATNFGMISIQQFTGGWLSGDGAAFAAGIKPGEGEDAGPLVRAIRHLSGEESVH